MIEPHVLEYWIIYFSISAVLMVICAIPGKPMKLVPIEKCTRTPDKFRPCQVAGNYVPPQLRIVDLTLRIYDPELKLDEQVRFVTTIGRLVVGGVDSGQLYRIKHATPVVVALFKEAKKRARRMHDWNGCQAVERVGGAWVFRGTRVPVSALFENLESGATVGDFLELFPNVTGYQADAVLKHAALSLRTM